MRNVLEGHPVRHRRGGIDIRSSHGGSAPRGAVRRKRSPLGFSLVEMMLVMIVMAVLISMSVPSFRRSMEQARADVAGANLRAIWTAQRLFWLENRTYAGQLATLESAGLLDPTIVTGNARYTYAITSATPTTFTAVATRVGSGKWTGQFVVMESGLLSGSLQATGEPTIVPGFQ